MTAPDRTAAGGGGMDEHGRKDARDSRLPEEIEKNKLLLLYMLERFGAPADAIMLSGVILEKRLMNYFIMQHSLHDLWDLDFLRRQEEGDRLYYEITENGRQFLSYYVTRLPLVTREAVRRIVMDLRDHVRKASEITAVCHEHEQGGWLVSCGIYENRSPVMEIRTLAGSRQEAQEITLRWKKDINRLYPDIMNLLLGGMLHGNTPQNQAGEDQQGEK